MKPIKIIAISGSLKSTSSNTSILNTIAKLAPKNVVVEIFEGIDLLPHFNPEITEDIPAVTLFRNKIKEADGVLFSTPEYAFGVPGVLKNALDWLVSSGEFNKKPIAAISVSTMQSGGDKALASLMLTLSVLGTTFTESSTLAIGSIKSKMNDTGEINSSTTQQELFLVLNSLLNSIAKS